MKPGVHLMPQSYLCSNVLSTYYVLDAVLGAWDILVTKAPSSVPLVITYKCHLLLCCTLLRLPSFIICMTSPCSCPAAADNIMPKQNPSFLTANWLSGLHQFSFSRPQGPTPRSPFSLFPILTIL